jgi:hypothetical protein
VVSGLAVATALAFARTDVDRAGGRRRVDGGKSSPGPPGRSAPSRRRPVAAPVERQVEQAGAVARVDHHLGNAAVDVAHGVDVEPVARHLRRLLVLASWRAKRPECLRPRRRRATGALGSPGAARAVPCAFGILALDSQAFLLQAVAVLSALSVILDAACTCSGAARSAR